MLVFKCDECGAQLKLKDESAGRKVRCPSCNAVVTAPAPSADDDRAAVTASAPTRRRSADDDDEPRSRKTSRRDAEDDDRRGVAPATSGKALASLLLSLANCLCLPFVLSLPSIILGIMAFVDVNRRPTQIKGKGMAIAGIVLSILGNVFYVVAILVFVFLTPFAMVGGLGAVGGIKQAAGRQETVNNLKQIGLAMHNYHDQNKRLPPAPGMDLQKPDQPKLSWRVAMLPYIDQDPLFRQFNPTVAWDQQPNQPLLGRRPMTYNTPMNPPLDATTTFIQVCTGPKSLFPDTKTQARLLQIQDGSSNTIFALQAMSGAVPWTKPADIVMSPPGQPLPPGLQGQGLMAVAMCDGSVRVVDRSKVSDQTLRLAIDPKDGQIMPPDWD